MSQKKYYLIILIFVIGSLLVYLNRQHIMQYLAEQTIDTARNELQKDIETADAITFGHKDIDSLYDANDYTDFVFIVHKTGNATLQDIPTDAKILTMYSNKNFTKSDIGENSLLLPHALFDFITVNDSNIRYRILSVDKQRHNNYLYEIEHR